jgi:hypothetical protein
MQTNGTKITAHLTLKSRNAKTGPIPVSITSANSCPASCPFNRGNGCYAAGGPLAINWGRVNDGKFGGGWESFCDKVAALPMGQLWRHNQAGDLPGEGETIDAGALMSLVAANRGKRGFTYTHKPMDNPSNRACVKQANADGFTINLSANNLSHADRLAALGIAPVTVVLPADVDGAKVKTVSTPGGRTVTVCPATYRDDVSCASCGLCAVRDRKVVVGFPAHGATKRKASAVASN